MAAPGMIEIPIEEYNKLMDDSWKLTCLESAGVDNWQGFDSAMEMYQSESEDENG